jgi:hypothetical protein
MTQYDSVRVLHDTWQMTQRCHVTTLAPPLRQWQTTWRCHDMSPCCHHCESATTTTGRQREWLAEDDDKWQTTTMVTYHQTQHHHWDNEYDDGRWRWHGRCATSNFKLIARCGGDGMLFLHKSLFLSTNNLFHIFNLLYIDSCMYSYV